MESLLKPKLELWDKKSKEWKTEMHNELMGRKKKVDADELRFAITHVHGHSRCSPVVPSAALNLDVDLNLLGGMIANLYCLILSNEALMILANIMRTRTQYLLSNTLKILKDSNVTCITPRHLFLTVNHVPIPMRLNAQNFTVIPHSGVLPDKLGLFPKFSKILQASVGEGKLGVSSFVCEKLKQESLQDKTKNSEYESVLFQH